MDRLDRKDLRGAPFDVVLRGYDKRQVDERIRFLGAELAAAEHALRAAQTRAAALEEEVNQLRSGPGASKPAADADSGFGARLEKIIMVAREEAREVRHQAGTEAATLLEQARSEAEELRKRAADEIAARQAEAEQISAGATQKADQLVEQARIEADRLVASATESAGQRERASAQELHRLSRLRDHVTAELYRVKTVLDGLFSSEATEPGNDAVIRQDHPAGKR